MSSKRSILIVLVLFLFTLATRFIKLDWGDGFFFQPDENNMAQAITQLGPGNFDPHFYAYGQLPLYLSYFVATIIRFVLHQSPATSIPFEQAIITLRIFSAIFSSISIYIIYRIAAHLFSDKFTPLALALLMIFSPGLIQLAHFGTTESLLILVFLCNILFSQKYIRTRQSSYLVLAAINSAVGIASKLSAAIFILPIALALLYRFVEKPHFRYIAQGLIFLFITILLSAIFSPYNLINYKDFISSMNYETGVATGALKVFYTNQFIDSIPYLFQIQKIFPYSSGIFTFTLSVAGLLLLIHQFLVTKGKNFLNWSLVLIPALVYFMYFGQLYTKWFRFMSPIFFIIPLLAAVVLSQIKFKVLKILLLFIMIIPGLYFQKLYLFPDIRLNFSQWFLTTIPKNSVILSEAGNVINLPLDSSDYTVINYDFYNLDTNPDLYNSLARVISQSDYILIPSRRIFKNQANHNFPYSQSYYDNLFLGQLGFVQIKSFQINNYLLLNPEEAEETFSVFDQPVIRLYQKTSFLGEDQIKQFYLPQ